MQRGVNCRIHYRSVWCAAITHCTCRTPRTSCSDHMGSTAARVQTWNGSKWEFSSDFIQADEQILKPMIKAGADKYLADKKMTRRTAADCQS